MNTIVLTTCSANHLAQAKNLCDSVLKYNPSHQCVIGLVDRIDGRFEKKQFHPHTIIEAHELGLTGFHDMSLRYNVFELNCAMKSFFVQYLLDQHKPGLIIYLDSDILVFDSLQVVEDALLHHSFLVNPHCTRLYPQDGLLPSDRDLLRTGIFNAGFFALKNDEKAKSIITWLNQKMVHQCYDNPSDGLFVDQKWYNLIPVFFEGVITFIHPGCNVAYWNFHEREVKKAGEKFMVNGTPLVFFHFSGYSIDQPEKLSKHQTRYTQVSEDVKALLQIYHQALETSGHRNMLSLVNAYVQKKKSLGKKIKSLFKSN
jgi:lipopolysaccharide biosynthesis glycosyltransferase